MTQPITIRIPEGQMAYQLPSVVRLMGVARVQDPTPRLGELAMQYESAHTPQPCELRMPIQEATKLLQYLYMALRDAGALPPNQSQS